jgi:hypothetical protein
MLLALFGLSSAAMLSAELESAAGEAVAVDSRLVVPDCPEGRDIERRADGRALVAHCPSTGWRLVVPLVARAGGLRRGDLVRVEAAGTGYVVRTEGTVEQARADGRLVVRNARSGARFTARLMPDGRIVAMR